MHPYPNKAALRKYSKQCIQRVGPGRLCEVLPISSFSTQKYIPQAAANSANTTLGIV